MSALLVIKLSALVALLGSAVYWDLKERRIPNKVTVPGLLVGLLLSALIGGGFPGSALAGAAVALALSAFLVVLGGVGAGDAKLFAAVGSFVGVGGLLPVFVYGGIAGGILAVVNTIRRGCFLEVMGNVKEILIYRLTLGRHGKTYRLDGPGTHTVPYGLAIAVGALAAWFFPFAVMGVL